MVRRMPSPACHLPRPPDRGADVEVLKHDRIAKLQHLRIGKTRIRHMGMHGVGAVELGSRRRAGADGLIILMADIAEVEIVHGALCGCEGTERAESSDR